jgi:hypothetical protein
MDGPCNRYRRTTVCFHITLWTSSLNGFRIALQDRVSRLLKDPREDDTKEVDRLREILTTQFLVLDQLQQRATLGLFTINHNLKADDQPSAFDELDDSDDGPQDDSEGDTGAQKAAFATPTDNVVEPPEARRLSIPSTWVSKDNIYRGVELELRIHQAGRTLKALRESIADKSFQYSHVIRVAPRKGVRTRARGQIAKLNHLIAYHSRVYARCRAAMVRLGADHLVLDKYQILLKEHVRSSGALLNPNEPGSTRLKLSWIWCMGEPGDEADPAALRECELYL